MFSHVQGVKLFQLLENSTVQSFPLREKLFATIVFENDM